MNYKGLLVVLVLVAALVVGVNYSQGVQTSAAVVVPAPLTIALNALILAAVTLGFDWVFKMIGLDLRSLSLPIAVALAGFAVGEIQGWINLIPVAYDQLTVIVLNVLVVIVGGLGTLRAAFHGDSVRALLAIDK